MSFINLKDSYSLPVLQVELPLFCCKILFFSSFLHFSNFSIQLLPEDRLAAMFIVGFSLDGNFVRQLSIGFTAVIVLFVFNISFCTLQKMGSVMNRLYSLVKVGL